MYTSFEYRSEKHDILAKPFVEPILAARGFQTTQFGTELDQQFRKHILTMLEDEYAKSMRHRPDSYVVHEKHGLVTYDVKSEWEEHPNFAIEADSLYYIQCYKGSVFIFVDMPEQKPKSEWYAVACFAKDIKPRSIAVPRKAGYDRQCTRMKKLFPDTDVVPKPHSGGSGTPYCLISKRNSILLPLDRFIQVCLMVNPSERKEQQIEKQMRLDESKVQF